MPISNVYNHDCNEYMKTVPDKFFDLAIVDPPYGIGESKRKNYHPNASTTYAQKHWDTNCPDYKYFLELCRVSRNQIIWGGNYFDLPICPKPIVWDKQQPEGIDQAMFEYAWQSQTDKQAMIFRRSPAADNNKVSNGDRRLRQVRMRIHPTQKPVAIYKWLLKNYGKPGDKILDTHMGSQSSRIAAFDMGHDFWGCELDEDYFREGCKRFEQHKAQLKLFQP